MDDLIKTFVDKKIRKKGKEYQLSENSKFSAKDFAYRNKITSIIYNFIKSVFGESRERALYNKILAKVSTLVRQDKTHGLGALRIGYGNIQSFKDFELNPRQSWTGYTTWQTQVHFDTIQSFIEVNIPEEKMWSLKRYDNRVSKLSVHYHLLKIPIETTDAPILLSSKELLLTPHQEFKQRKVRFTTAGWDNCLLLVVGTVKSYIYEKDSSRDFLTTNKSLLAGAIIAVFGLREGKQIEDSIESSIVKIDSPTDNGIDWE